MEFGTQGAAYMGQAHDRAAFDRFILRFSEPPTDWLNIADEMAQWLWDWNAFCHEALVEQSERWPSLLRDAGPEGPVSDAGIKPWNEGQNRAPADDADAWELVYARNANR